MSDVTLTESEVDCLRCLVGWMLPANGEFEVPGADDARILADMVRSTGRETAALKRILGVVQREFGDKDGAVAEAVDIGETVARLRDLDRSGFAALEAVVVRAYYRDDRVLRSIGMEARPPFPQGYAIEQGDFSRLEAVKARGPIWRDANS